MKTKRYTKQIGYGIAFFALTFFLTMGIHTTTPSICAQEKVVKIGVLLPMSGFLATTGEWIHNGISLAVDDINDAGGIKSMGGARIKIIVTDSKGNPDVAMAETERLILREKVCTIIGAYQSSTTFTSSNISEKYKVPYMVATAVKNEITGREGFKYVFRHTGNITFNAATMAKSFYEVATEIGYKLQTAAVIGENTDFGQGAEQVLKKVLPELGIKIVMVESYPLTISDVSPIITKLKNANPDVVFITGYVADTILMVKTAAALKFNVPFVSSGGENNPTFLKSVGNSADYNFVRGTFNKELARTRPELKAIVDRYEKKFGLKLTTETADNYVTTWILKDALERAKSIDPEKLREALAKTDIPAGQPWMIQMNDRITFDASGQNPRPPYILVQYRNAAESVVWPKKYRQVEPVLPKP